MNYLRAIETSAQIINERKIAAVTEKTVRPTNDKTFRKTESWRSIYLS